MPILAEIFPVGRFLGGLIEGAIWAYAPLLLVVPGFLVAFVVAASIRAIRKLARGLHP